MSDLATEYADHLTIHEAAAQVAGPMRPDGLVPIHVIRPGIGRGKGRHLYEASMLERSAPIFRGWKMFVDHQAPEAKRAQGGLPRSVRDLGGIIKESWWDGDVPADAAKGHGKGAVVALCRPTPLVRQLIETDPALVEASISARATGVRPVKDGGGTAWAVEGFEPTGSVDWVSMAGAGGKVAALQEALQESMTDEDWQRELVESMTDAELAAAVRDRPEEYAGLIAEAAKKKPPPADDEPEPGAEGSAADAAEDEAELQKLAEKYVAQGMSPAAARAKARASINESTTTREEDVDGVELLTEALATDEGKAALNEIVESMVDERFAKIAAPKLAELVEAGLEEERELITAEAEARADRKLQVRELRDSAHAQINESRLPDTFKRELRARFDLAEGEPTDALDVADEKDDAGKVVKKAEDVLKEAVGDAIAEKQKQHREIAPTTVRGQGPATEEGEEDPEEAAKQRAAKAAKDKEEGKVEEHSTGSAHTDHLFAKSGVQLDESLYEDIIPGA